MNSRWNKAANVKKNLKKTNHKNLKKIKLTIKFLNGEGLSTLTQQRNASKYYKHSQKVIDMLGKISAINVTKGSGLNIEMVCSHL